MSCYKFQFARRTDWKLTPNHLMSHLELIKKDDNVLDLTQSNPTQCGFQYPRDNILSPLADFRNMHYDPAAYGSLEAREAICGYYQNKGNMVDPQRIVLTASTSEAYSFLFRLLVNTGERVLIPAPSYPLFEFLLRLNDVHLDTYPLVYDKGWRIDLNILKNIICSDTRVIVLVNPNNPTGSFVKREELEAINKMCCDKNVSLICDEVFFDYSFEENNKQSTTLVGNIENLTFVLGGLSKSLALPQMKLSWLVINGPQEIVKSSLERLEIIADTYLSVNTPSQNSMPQWLSLQSIIQQEVMVRLKSNKEFLKDCLSSEENSQYLRTEGGWYAIFKLPSRRSEEAWVLDFLQKDRVFVHPGYFFDFPDEPYIILSLLPPPIVFQRGVRRILARVQH